MDSGKSLGVLFVLVGIMGIYLQSQGKLSGTWDILTEPDGPGSTVHAGTMAIALVAFVVVLSTLNDRDSVLLTLLFVLGALLFNKELSSKLGQQDALTVLTGK